MMTTMMKKTPQSSSYGFHATSLALILLMIILTFSTTAASSVQVQEPKSRSLEGKIKRQQLVAVQSRTTHRLRHSWNAISSSGGGGGGGSGSGSGGRNVKSPPVECFQLRRFRHYCPPFPALAPPTPPSPSDYEIDPRYGVEKRLVPSGPNPLHN